MAIALSITTPHDQAMAPRPAAFLDRDGVLNIDHGYAHRPDQMTWVDGAVQAVQRLNERGFFVFVVTNQAGIARGLYTENHVRSLHDWMDATFRAQAARIDAFAYCPHHPEGDVAEYRTVCTCRKPNPGLLLGLMDRFPVQREGSFMVGDRDTDMAAASAANVPGHLFTGGNINAFIAEIIKA